MQNKSLNLSTELIDTLGRRNRKHADRLCARCGTSFRPLRDSSKYCSRPCLWIGNGKSQVRQDEVWWVNRKGYVEGRVVENGHVRRVKKHRWLMEQHLGRRLLQSEDVHHKNEIKTDNRIDNLEVKSHGQHSTEHNLSRAYKRGYKLNLSTEERQRRSDRMRLLRTTATGPAKSERVNR